MANFKFVKSATAAVLGASVLTTAVVVPGADASAKTTYKVNKNGTLVNAKTNKAVKGYKTYKGKLYKNGKKFTGKTSSGVYYVKGKKFTGKTKYGYYYVNGKRFTGTTKYGYYYVNGKRFNGKTKYGNLYVDGKRYTGTTKYGYTYYNGKRVEGEYKAKVYTNGKLVTGLYKDKLYNKGVLETGLDLYKDKLYKDGVLNVGYALYNEDLYKDAAKNEGFVADPLKDGKAYNDTKLANGTFDVDGVEKAYEDGVEVGAKVKSVEAINAKSIKVTFNKSLKSGTTTGGAGVLTNYTVDGTSPDRVVLSDDKKSVTLTYAAGLVSSLDKYLEVNVKNLKDVAGNDVEAYKAPLLFTDATAPTASVSYTAPTAKVTFSELLNASTTALTGATVSVDGVTTTSYSVTVDNSADGLIGASAIKIAGLTAGSHTISIVGATDLAGNKLPAYTGSVTVAADTTAPKVTSLTAEGNKVRVKFSEPVVDVTDLYATGTDAAVVVSDGTNKVYATAADAVDEDGTEFLIDATTLINAGSSFSTKNVTVLAGSKDASGNASEALTKSLTITKDTTAPTVADTFVDGKNIVVKFNEAIQAGSATVPSTVSVAYTDADGVVNAATAKTVDTLAYAYDANDDGDTTDSGEDKYLVIPVTDATIISGTTLKSGSYKVSLIDGIVADASSLDNEATTVSFTVGSSSNVLANVQAQASEVSTGVLEYTFTNGTSAVELTSAQLKAANFTIDGVAVPADSKIYFYGDKSTVRVELPASFITVSGNRTLSVANIVDEDGNTLSKTAANIQTEEYLTENVKPVAGTVLLADNHNVTVQMSEVIAADPTTGIELWVNGSKVDSTDVAFDVIADSNSKNTIIKLTTTNKVLANTDSIVVKFTATNDAADAAGNTTTVGQVSK